MFIFNVSLFNITKCRYPGELSEDLLREIMTTMGERWTDESVDELIQCGANTSSKSASG